MEGVGVAASPHQADMVLDPMSTDPTPCHQLDLLVVLPLLEEVAPVVDTAADPTTHTRPDRDLDRQRPDDGVEAEEVMEQVDTTVMIPDAAAAAAASTATRALHGTEVAIIDDEGTALLQCVKLRLGNNLVCFKAVALGARKGI